MEPVRLGIVGCGATGAAHAAIAAANTLVELVAVADIDVQLAQATAGKYPNVTAYDNRDRLFADERIEAVILAIPTNVRTDAAREALRRNKHVLLEKPPAMNAGELHQMIALRGDRVIGCCSSRYTFRAGAEMARRVVTSGELGPLRVIRARNLNAVGPQRPDAIPPPWRINTALNGGGFLVNFGIYDLDYLMHVTAWQLTPKTIFAQTWPIAESLRNGRVAADADGEHHAMAMIRCECGAVIFLERGECTAVAAESAWQVIGEKGSLRLDMTGASLTPPVIKDIADPIAGLHTVNVIEPAVDMHCDEKPVVDFVNAIRTGNPPRTSVDRALILQEMIDAIYEAARTGRAVELHREKSDTRPLR